MKLRAMCGLEALVKDAECPPEISNHFRKHAKAASKKRG